MKKPTQQGDHQQQEDMMAHASFHVEAHKHILNVFFTPCTRQQQKDMMSNATLS